MALVDDLAEPVPQVELDRRKALGLLGSGALALAGLGTTIVGLQYMWPNVLFEEDKRYKIGRPEDIPVGQVVVLPREKIYVVHLNEGFAAITAVCTHLGCMTRFESEEKRFFCPCHGSRYDLEGNVTGGPAPKKLPRFQVTVDKGVLMVDASKVVDPDFVLKV